MQPAGTHSPAAFCLERSYKTKAHLKELHTVSSLLVTTGILNEYRDAAF